MPTYLYTAAGDQSCRYCQNTFERRQKVSDARLETCPECGSAVRRVLTAPNLATSSPDMSEKNIEKQGFTKYQKVEKGVYEKTAGKGPDMIKDEN